MLEEGVEGLRGKISIFLFVCLFDWPSVSLNGKEVEIKAREDKV